MNTSKNLLTAMNQVMSKVGYVQKTGRNEFHKYRYAGEGDLLAVLRPAMVEAGLVLIPSVEGQERTDEHGNTYLTIVYTLAHVSGEVWPNPVRVVGCGNDKSSKGTVGDKGVYKAMTGANKYALFKLFQIETGDEPEADHEGQGGAAAAPASKPTATTSGKGGTAASGGSAPVAKWAPNEAQTKRIYGLARAAGIAGKDAFRAWLAVQGHEGDEFPGKESDLTQRQYGLACLYLVGLAAGLERPGLRAWLMNQGEGWPEDEHGLTKQQYDTAFNALEKMAKSNKEAA